MRWRGVVLAAVVMVLLAVAGGSWWLHHNLWGSHSDRTTNIEISAGSSARQVLRQLEAASLVPSPFAARIYLKIRADGRSLHFGRYAFAAGLRPVDVLEMVLDGNVEIFELTVLEGETAAEIGEGFAAVGVGDIDQWKSILARVEWVAPQVPDAPSLEGFLFPDTYRFAVGIAAETAARHLVDQFLAVWREESSAAAVPWGSPLEVVTLASLVEAETSLEDERPLIAGVFVNRLRRGMLLQCDPTVVYALKRRNEWQGRLFRVHWEVDDPYNTYRYPGLPPGPINSPGRSAIAAALAPAATNYLYFVAKPGGGHAFSRTLSEHNRAVARLRAAGR